MGFKSNKKSYDLNIPTVSGKVEFADPQKKRISKGCFLGQRHLVTLLGFVCYFVMIALRLVIGVGIVAMVKHGAKNESSNFEDIEIYCPLPPVASKSLNESVHQGEFDWSSELQGWILGIGFLSYLIMLVPGGRLADAWKSKQQLMVSNAVSGIVTIISPFAARWHPYALMAALFVRGASQAFTLPAMYKLINNWVPKHERGTLSTLVVSGMPTGLSVGGIVTGWLCDIPGFGWPSAFYIWGGINLVFALAIHFVCYEHPEDHPYITKEEVKYINEGLENEVSEMRPRTPWKGIFTSVPCYAYFYGLFGHYWSITYYNTTHPTFMGTVLHYSMTENGLTSCLPVLMKSVGGVTGSIMSYWISKKNLMSISKLRKLTTCLGALGFSLCMAMVQLAGCDGFINILCFAISLFFTGIALSGVMIAGVDMAPAFAGLIMGIATSIANWACVLIPVIAGVITKNETLSEWRIVFWMNFAVVGSSGLIYVIFGSAEVQSWNYSDDKYTVKCNFNGERMSSEKSNVSIDEERNNPYKSCDKGIGNNFKLHIARN